MVDVKIRINGQIIDYDDVIPISYSIADINQIGVRKNATTKTLKAPATKRNQLIFGFPEDINSVEYINQNQLYTGEIESDGSLLLDGYVKFIKPIKKKSTEYHFIIIGDNGNWTTNLDNNKLSEIDLSDQNHAYTKENIDLAENISNDRMYSYPIINRGDFGDLYIINVIWFVINSAKLYYEGEIETSGFTQGDTLKLYGFFSLLNGDDMGEFQGFYNSSGADANGNYIVITIEGDNGEYEQFNGNGFIHFDIGNPTVRVTDRVPAINIKKLLYRIFKNAGYKVVSHFFENYGSKLFMLKDRNDFLTQPEEFYTNQEMRAFSTINIVMSVDDTDPTFYAYYYGYYWLMVKWKKLRFNTDESDNLDLFNTSTYEYTVAQNGKQIFRFNTKINAIPVGRGRLGIIKETSDGTKHIIVVKDLLNTTEPAINHEMNMNTGWIDVEVGEKYFVAFSHWTYETGETDNVWTFLHQDTEFTNEVQKENIRYGSTVYLNRYLPDDITELEYLNALKHLFNLYVLTDTARKQVIIETRDRFYTNVTTNWTGKLDVDKPIEIQEIDVPYKKQQLSYKSDSSDAFVEKLNEISGVELHSKTVDFRNVFAKDEVNVDSNNLFAPTFMDYINQSAVKLTHNKIPKIWDEQNRGTYPQNRVIFEPRILFYEGVVTLEQGEYWNWEGIERTELPLFYSLKDTEFNYNSLAFSDNEKAIGLSQRYYASTFKEMKESRLYIAYLKLTHIDVARFAMIDNENRDFRGGFFIDINNEGAYFRINEINDYRADNNDSTKVELIKIVDKGFVPQYPISKFECSNLITDEQVQQGDLLNFGISITNIGGQTATAHYIVEIAGYGQVGSFDVTLNGGQTAIVNQSITVPLTIQNGSDILIVKCEQYETLCQSEFYVQQCTLPGNINFVNLSLNPEPNQLQTGSNLNVSIEFTNTGCLATNCNLNLVIKGTTSGTIYNSQVLSINLQGGQSNIFTHIFQNLPHGEGSGETLELVITGCYNHSEILYVPNVNPNIPPLLVDVTPDDNSINFNTDGIFYLVFDVPIFTGSGTFRIINTNTGSVVASISPNDITQCSINANQVVINPTITLASNTNYHIKIDEGFVKNGNNVNYAGINNSTDWNFTTGAITQVLTVYNTLGNNIITPIIPNSPFVGIATNYTEANHNNIQSGLMFPNIKKPEIENYFRSYWINGTELVFETGIKRALISFDTSAIPDNATIVSAELKLYITETNTGIVVLKGLFDDVPEGIEFSSFALPEIGEKDILITGYNSIFINTSEINKTGWTRLMFREKLHDFLNEPLLQPGNWDDVSYKTVINMSDDTYPKSYIKITYQY